MRIDRLKSFALALPQTKVVGQWGGLVFKVVEKAFFMILLDGETINGVIFKCTPEEFTELTDIDSIGQAPYFAKRMWVHVEDLAALPEQELKNRIRGSYALVAAKLPKKVQATLK